MRLAKSILLASTLLSASGASAVAEINVVASIKPVHSLVAAVMEGVGEPGLIIDGAGSPHNYALKPSQARMLENANVVFWIGHEMEAFLEKPLETVGANAKSVELIDAHDLIKLSFREGGAFEKHDHDDHADEAEHDHAHDHDDDHDHDDHDHEDHGHEHAAEATHDDHDHDDHGDEHAGEAGHDDHDHDDDHGHSETAEADGHDHEDHEDHAHHAAHEGHDHGAFDAHVWVDPMNAKAMVHEIEEALAAADPANAARYEENAEAVMGKLDTLISDVSADLEPVKGKGFIVFHDAYQYFENRFGITASGSITVSPEVLPGAERITEIRARLAGLGETCVFAEPQFEPKLVSTVIEGTQAKSGVIDPLGAELENGPDLYFQIIRNMATSIKTCLSQGS